MSDDELRKLVNCVQLVDIRTVSVEGRIDISDGVSEDIDDEGELPLSFETAVAVRDDAQGLMASFTATFDRGSTSSAPATHMKIAVAVFYELEGWGRTLARTCCADLLRRWRCIRRSPSFGRRSSPLPGVCACLLPCCLLCRRAWALAISRRIDPLFVRT